MILVDTNLLAYATFADAPEHRTVRGWLEERLTRGGGAVVVCWPVLYEFLRLITSPRVFGAQAVTVTQGWHVLSTCLGHPAVRLVTAGSGHPPIAAELAAPPGLRSDDVPDVEIAALADDGPRSPGRRR